MRALVATVIMLLWLAAVCGAVYLAGAWVMLDWDYVAKIGTDDRGGMIVLVFLLSASTFWLPGVIYEGVFEP